MKKKNLSIFAIFIIIALTTTGCFKRDTLEDIEIVTTDYPLEYIVNELYGEHSTTTSIYPDGTNTNTYKLTDKLISDYSEKDLFVYNGLSADKDMAIKFLDNNKDMLIIDSSFGMELTYGNFELWLNPSNLLMMSQNVRNGLEEYITNNYLENSIDEKYETLKIALSELDAEIKLTAENAARTTIVVNSDSLKYLEKYGFTVISLDDSTEIPSEKTIETVKSYITSGTVKSIFLLENTANSDELKDLIKDTKIKTVTFRNLSNITDEERDNKVDYIDIMKNNIELLKTELYD